jgi:NitT/TauT family transport system permease protein
MKKRISSTITIIISISIVLTIWFVISYIVKIRTLYLPTPIATFSRLIDLSQTEMFWLDILYSFKRVLIGFGLSFIVAYPLMLVSLLNKNVKKVVFNLVEFFRYLPIPVFIPLTILWFGIGDFGKIFIIFLGTFAQMVPMFYDSANLLNNKFPAFTAALKWKKTDHIKKIIIPGSAPLIMDNARLCFGWAWTYLIIAELLGAENGMGYAIIRAQRYLATDKIFAYIIAIGFIGVLIDRSIYFFKNKLFKWQL